MIKINRNKKMRKEREAEVLYSMATKPASINITMLISDVQKTVHDYILAIYAQKAEWLPMERMEEEMYYAVKDSILRDKQSGIARSVNVLNIREVKPVKYDNRLFYAVQSVSYEVSLHIEGETSSREVSQHFSNDIKCKCIFCNDSRMGWLLYQCELQ